MEKRKPTTSTVDSPLAFKTVFSGFHIRIFIIIRMSFWPTSAALTDHDNGILWSIIKNATAKLIYSSIISMISQWLNCVRPRKPGVVQTQSQPFSGSGFFLSQVQMSTYARDKTLMDMLSSQSVEGRLSPTTRPVSGQDHIWSSSGIWSSMGDH